MLLRPLGLVIGVALLFPAAAGTPEPIQAAGSCTGWGSTTIPPNSIRVLRSNSGAVETVDFKRYVTIVMGKEWGPSLPNELLKAGAQATKQFAWYHSLEGNHRSSYFAGGKCFDVKDSTADQLYRPENVTIYDSQRRAVDAIWDLSLRKSSGRFFLTQYRTGQTGVECGADADGTKLFARSARKCANAGWSFSRILEKYYNSNETWTNTSATGSSAVSTSFSATVSQPRTLFRTGAAISSAPILVTWRPTSGESAISKYQVQRRVSGVWKNLGGQSASDTDYDINVKWGTSQRFRVRAKNSAGKAGSWSTGPTFTPYRVDDRSSAVKWSGTWNRKSDAGSFKGTTTTSTQSGASVTYKFTGRSIAVVGTLGPGRGKARIYINGKLATTVDLYKSTKRAGRVIYSRSWARSATRTIKVVVVGTSSRPRVDIDAFLYVR